jgi:cytochrome c553
MVKIRTCRKRDMALRAALVALWIGGDVRADAQPPVFNRPSAIFPAGDPQRGLTLSTPCIACHGDAAVTFEQPPFHAPKLRYQRPSSIFYALQDYREGRRRSPLMTSIAQRLTDQDMRDLSVYVTAGPNRRRGPATGGPTMASGWAHEKVGQVCGLCHGESGLSVMDGYPALGGQYEDYLDRALRDYQSGIRSNPIMQHVARTLTRNDIRRLAIYFAAQPDLEVVK